MAITTVRPNATASGSGSFTISGGSATLHAALNDDSDSTFIQKTSSVVGQASAILDFGTTTISATERVKQVRIRARCSTPTDEGRLNIYLGSRVTNQNFFHSALAIRGENTSITTFTGPFYNSAPNGSSWAQASINGLRAKITEYEETGDRGKFVELFIDIDIAAQPTVTVSAPTGTITSTTAPDVTWAYADTDNETQAYYHLKVFSAAQYGANGFNPETSIATYDSGEIASSDNTAVVGSLLDGGTYRAYVQVGKAVNGQPFFSDYAFSQFVISYTAPTVPTLAVAWSSLLGKATFTLTGAAVPGAYVSQYFEVVRSDNNGTTFDYIRTGRNIIPNASHIGTAVDYEAPRDNVAFYKVRSVAVDSSDQEFPSAFSVVQQVLITNDATWWFKAIEEPEYNLGSVRVLKELDVQIDEPNTIFRPLGSGRPIVVAGPLQGEDGGYNIKTLTEPEWDSFYEILTYQGSILVQDPFGNQKYIRITSRDWTAETQAGQVYRDIVLRYVEVGSEAEVYG